MSQLNYDQMPTHKALIEITQHLNRLMAPEDVSNNDQAVLAYSSTLVLQICGDYTAITFLDFPIWDSEEDDREIDEETPGNWFKVDLETHLKEKIVSRVKDLYDNVASLTDRRSA